MGTPSFLSTQFAINVSCVMVNNPLDWSVLLISLEKNICSYFDLCLIPLYEYLFTRIGFWLPFYDFEVVVLKHL